MMSSKKRIANQLGQEEAILQELMRVLNLDLSATKALSSRLPDLIRTLQSSELADKYDTILDGLAVVGGKLLRVERSLEEIEQNLTTLKTSIRKSLISVRAKRRQVKAKG